MASTNLVKTLTRKYAQLSGEYEFAERMVEDASGLDAIIAATERSDQRKKEIDEKLEAIETVIWLFDPEWDPAAVRPKYPRMTYAPPKAISRAAYAILRDASVPMTTREIARIVASRLGYREPSERDMARIDTAVHGVLSKKVGRTIEIVSENPKRWAIIHRDKVRSRNTSANLNVEGACVEMPRRPSRRLAS